MTAILGLNAFHGDAAAALVIDGELVNAVEEERLNRVKHCAGFPELAARWCLEDAGLDPRELDHVAIGRDPRANIGAKVVRTILNAAESALCDRALPQRDEGAGREDAGRRSARS